MRSKLKILTIVYDLAVGGTQRAAQNFAMAYLADGHDSRMLPIYDAGPRKAELLAFGVEVYPHGDDLEESLKLINIWHPDIVHIHRSGEADFILCKILRALKVNGTKVIETNVFSRADHSKDFHLVDVHCHLSEWCIWRWSQFLKNKSIGVVIPYLVIENNFFKESKERVSEFKKRYGLPLDKFIFGRIGQRSIAKFNKETYLSFDRLYMVRSDIHLFIVGLPSVFFDEVMGLSSFREGAISLIDSIVGDEELRLAYNSIDCFLAFSTIGESFGMVLAEAQLCEVPVISVSTPKADNSQLEVLIHEKSSIIIKSPKYLVKVMGDFASGQYSLEMLGKNGRQHIQDSFTPKVVIPQVNLLFNILIENVNVRLEISKHFKSNLKRVSIEHLKLIGYGEYDLSVKLFFLSPKYYLKLAGFIFLLKKKIRL